jgi:hypothetical protein
MLCIVGTLADRRCARERPTSSPWREVASQEARDLDVFPLVEHDHVFIVSNQRIEAEETYIYALH